MSKILGDLEYKIKRYNSYEILEEYIDIFEKNKESISFKIIKEGSEYFRARPGQKEVKGAIDDCDIEMNIPYYRSEIGAAPILYTKGGRFNREGTSYLYLGTDVNTCVSELRLQKGQICSIGKFKCIKEGKYFNLSNTTNESNFFNEVKEIMLQPVHSENRYNYLITQFISDIIRISEFDGIIYESTQGDGISLVSFDVNAYEFIDYSDEIYKITKVEYETAKLRDGYEEYVNTEELLNSYNSEEEEKKEETFEYLSGKIDYKNKKNFQNKVDFIKNSEEECKEELYTKLVETFKGKYKVKAFELRGDYYKVKKEYDKAIADYYNMNTYFRIRNKDKALEGILSKFNNEEVDLEFVKNVIDKIELENKSSLERLMLKFEVD